MNTAPQLLNDDGTASMATAVTMSHLAFRRDLACFAASLTAPGLTTERLSVLRDEWQSFHHHLHGHHEAEDGGLFPSLRAQRPELGATIDRLGKDHRRIDPLLEQGDRAFAELEKSKEAAIRVVRELLDLLNPHLTLEETELLPHLRGATSFPPAADEAMLAMYAEGFAWSCHGIAPHVLEKVYAMLPEALLARLPEARAAFAARYERAFGGLG